MTSPGNQRSSTVYPRTETGTSPHKDPSTGIELILNEIPFKPTVTEVSLSFNREKKPRQFALKQHEFPINLIQQLKKESEEVPEYLYTGFKHDPDADYQITIDLTNSHNFAKHYYRSLLVKSFRPYVSGIGRDFTKNTVFLTRDEPKDLDHQKAYKRFRLNLYFRKHLGTLVLSVQFDGHTYVLDQSVLAYTKHGGSTTDCRWYMHKGYLFHQREIEDDEYLHQHNVYPVLTKRMRQQLKLERPFYRVENALMTYKQHIDTFREQVIYASDIDQKLKGLGSQPVSPELAERMEKGWLKPDADRIGRIQPEAQYLRFGDGQTHVNGKAGLQQFSPYRSPTQQHFEVFFIVHSNHTKSKANPLTNYLKNGYKEERYREPLFPGINDYIDTPLQLSDDHIVFQSKENPYPEIASQLHRKRLDPNKTYLAIYISPIPSYTKDWRKRQVYYRVKEALLNKGITSQVVDATKIGNKNFPYFLSNISLAILAKLGGIPWTLDKPGKPELIVGIGAKRNTRLDEQFLGSAFCYDHTGHLHEFDCFAKKDAHLLAGAIRDAVNRYVSQHRQVERLVIHFYKRMGKKDWIPIHRSLRELNLKIPVIILSINKTLASDNLAFDTNAAHHLPLNGTYLRLNDHQILLYNNERFFESTTTYELRSYPNPLKIYLDANDDSLLKDEETIRTLMTQVNQFSRLYWRSDRQQSLPITISYPAMVAEVYPYFNSQSLPEYARNNLWFL
jgi:hypothetical protein